MKLSIVIPCFNEKATILELINAVRRAPIEHKQIIIIDDGSTDGTREILKMFQDVDDIEVIYHDKNKGKGAALRTGFAAAMVTYVLYKMQTLNMTHKNYHIDKTHC